MHINIPICFFNLKSAYYKNVAMQRNVCQNITEKDIEYWINHPNINKGFLFFLTEPNWKKCAKYVDVALTFYGRSSIKEEFKAFSWPTLGQVILYNPDI